MSPVAVCLSLALPAVTAGLSCNWLAEASLSQKNEHESSLSCCCSWRTLSTPTTAAVPCQVESSLVASNDVYAPLVFLDFYTTQAQPARPFFFIAACSFQK